MRGSMDAATFPALEVPWQYKAVKQEPLEHDDSGISPGRATGPGSSSSDGPSPTRPSSTPLLAALRDAGPRRPDSSPAGTDPLLGLQRALDALSREALHCPLCDFSTAVKPDMTDHLATHYPHKSPEFDTRCQGAHERLTPSPNTDPEDTGEDEDQSGVRIPRVNSQGKVKTFRCKQCDFVAVTKLAFWDHSRAHIKAERLLTCPKCPFVTEYKHHLEYHLRNHFGSKPFKCDKCSYSCVNKSMLNSHLKSHSNVYQYRCADCSYATKYCHSLKLHLRKYSHHPAMVLNPDGSPNPLPIIDVYGTRRGPKQRTKGTGDDSLTYNAPFSTLGVPFPFAPLLNGAFTPPNSSPVPAFPYNNIGTPAPDTPKEGFDAVVDNYSSPYQKYLALHSAYMFDSQQNEHLSPGINSNELMNDSVARAMDFRQPLQLENTGTQNDAKDFLASQCTHDSVRPIDFRQKVPAENNNTLEPNYSRGHLQMERKIQECKSDYTMQRPSSTVWNTPRVLDYRLKGDPKPIGTDGPLEPAEESSQGPLKASQECENVEQLPKNENAFFCHSPVSEETPKERQLVSNPLDLSKSGTELTPVAKSRRKGKAYKLERIAVRLQAQADQGGGAQQEPSPNVAAAAAAATATTYSCAYCDITFRDIIMYTMHMGYHGYRDPFQCNMCGQETADRVAFFLHIARTSHC